MLDDEKDEFVAFHIPRKSLSKDFHGKYRIYFRDGSSEDFAAETVTQALAQLDDSKTNTVMKIINLETEYKKTLKNNFLLPTEESVPTQIAADDNAPKNLGFYFFGDLADEDQSTTKEPFEAVSLIDVASITSGEEIAPVSQSEAEEGIEVEAEEVPQALVNETSVKTAEAEIEPVQPEMIEGVAPEPEAPQNPPEPQEEKARLSTQEVRNLLNNDSTE